MKPYSPFSISLLAALLAGVLLAGCGEKKDGKDEHGHGAKPESSHAADSHDTEGEKRTHFTESSELFVEYPSLVVGQGATFAAHLTRLADFKPLAASRLTVVLAGEGSPEERFSVDAPSVPGIYKPVVTPKSAGKRQMTLIAETASGVLTHELGPVEVFADAKTARAQHAEEEKTGEIPFSKEQQWKIDFATTEAVKGAARRSLTATGTIKATPDGEARLVAQSAGSINPAGAFPRVGQVVRKGQVLAYLAPRLGSETDQATLEAAAGKARIGLEQARRERERMESLFKDEAVAEKRLLDARANERIAAAEQDAAQRRMAQLGGSGGIALRAPISGVIAEVSVSAGAFVTEGAPLIHIANTDKLWLEARVPESDIGRLVTPVAAAFPVAGADQSVVIEAGKNGKLIAVGGAVDSVTRTVPVIFEFDNPGRALRLGMTVKVQLLAKDVEEGVLVPASALQDESGTQVVYVQIEGESFVRRIVQSGARDGDLVVISAGLEPKERVVSKGAYLVRLSTSKAGPSGHGH